MVVTGVTNKSGKTTLLEGLASRGEMQKFLVFRSKPDEQVFREGHFVKPFLQEQADWRYMKQLLESSERMKLKFETWHIMQAAKNTENLGGFYENCVERTKSSKREMDKQIFEVLAEYTKTLLQELKDIVFTREFPDLKPGINLMDLSEVQDEDIQSIIIRSTLDHVLHHCRGVVVIIPELWKFSPQGRNNPVKETLQALVRQGATKKNFVWVDSQDMSGTDKAPLKQCYTWILGLQTESNEAEHTLEQINLPPKTKPKAFEITSLSLGQFFLSTPKGSMKFYALPKWLNEETAIKVAKGKMDAESAFAKYAPKDQAEEITNPVLMQEVKAQKSRAERLEQEAEALRRQVEELSKPKLDPETIRIVEKYRTKSPEEKQKAKEQLKAVSATAQKLTGLSKWQEQQNQFSGEADITQRTTEESRSPNGSSASVASVPIVGQLAPASPPRTLALQQSLPNIVIQQLKPMLSIPVELLDKPNTTIGRVCVILKNFSGRQHRWTNKSIKEEVRTHAWDDQGVDEAIDQLIRWEVLKRQSNNYLKFYPERVSVVEKRPEMVLS